MPFVSVPRTYRGAVLLLALSLALHSSNAAYRFVTYAGESSVGAADGDRLTARFIAPSAVAVDQTGNVYVADTGNHTVRKISPQGVVTTVAGSPGRRGSTNGVGAEARFDSPTGIAISSSGDLLVADCGNHTIRQISPDGRVSTLAGSPGISGITDGPATDARFYAPRGIAVDPTGNIYVCERLRIRGISPTGTVRTIATPTSGNPVALTLDPAGRLYVAMEARNSIDRIFPDGRSETLGGFSPVPGSAWGATSFSSPQGIASSSDGTIYVADASGTIYKISPTGSVDPLLAQSSSSPEGLADGPGIQVSFSDPAGLAVDLAGNVYVAERGNNVIRQISPTAQVLTLAGFPLSTPPRDGAAREARFESPRGLAFGPDESLYLADLTAIRRLSSVGIASTVARTPDALAWHVHHPLYGTTRVAVTATGEIYMLGGFYQRTVGRLSSTGELSIEPGVFNSGAWIGDICWGSDKRLYTATNYHGLQAWVWESKSLYPGTILGYQQLPENGALSGVSFDALASDAAGNFYLAYRGTFYSAQNGDVTSTSIIKFSSDGTLTLVAGQSGSINRTSDGRGAAAGFGMITGMALDAQGNLLVVDHDNHTVRQVAPDGTVTTIGGVTGAAGHAEGVGAEARFYFPEDIVVAANGDLYLTSGKTIIRGIKINAPTIQQQPTGATLAQGSSYTLSVSASGEPPLSYQWSRNGTPLPNGTNASYTVSTATNADAGTYTVTVSNPAGSVTSANATVAVTAPSSSAQSSSGGGGAPSLWSVVALLCVCAAHFARRRTTRTSPR